MKTLTKLWAVLVLAVFVLSIIPVALADNEAGKVDNNVDKIVGEDKLVKDVEETVKESKEAKELDKEKLKEKVSDAKDKATAIHEEKLKELKDKLLERRHKIAEDMKEKVSERRELVQQYKTEKKVASAKAYLLRTTELMSLTLEKLQDRVENSKAMTEEEKTQALDSITKLEEKLTAEKLRVETLAENATAEEIRAITKELKDTWTEVRREQRWIITQLINSRQDNLVEKHTEYYNAMQMRIDSLKKQNVETSALEQLAAKFKEQVDELKADYQAMEELWKQVKDRESLTEVHEAQREVREDIVAAKTTLREFLSKYKELAREAKVKEMASAAGSDNGSATA